jgi:enamine deaminase RidA (YjgF/YER057c/UK114 family)
MSPNSTPPIGRVTEIYPRPGRAGTPSSSTAMPLGLRVDHHVVALRMSAEKAGPDLRQQARAVFGAMRELAEQAGGGLRNIAKATAYVSSVRDRASVNGEWWEEMFPDPADKPAYKVLVAPLPAGRLIELDVLAILGGTRRRIDVPGVPARDPTVVIGGMLFTSRVHGTVPFTGDRVAEGGVRGQAEQAFRNVLTLVAMGGGNPGDIIQLTSFGREPGYAGAVREALAGIFPDEAVRPPLVTLTNFIPAKFEVMVEMTAAIGGNAGLRGNAS